MHDARTPQGTWIKDAEVMAPGQGNGPGKVAVLEVHPRGIAFLIGWRHVGGTAELYSQPVKTLDARLAMLVGGGDVIFVARPCDGRTRLIIELVELTDYDDPKYADLPHY